LKNRTITLMQWHI